MKGRIKFTIWGEHPYLLFLRDHLILSGFVLVNEDPDFVLVGGAAGWQKDFKAPVILLSSDKVYSDKDLDFKVRDKKPMKEDDPIVIFSPFTKDTELSLNYLLAENYFLRNNALILRIFGVYGPNIKHGLIYNYICCVKNNKPLKLINPGYQTRTYLHEVDFLQIFDRMVFSFISGTRGIYNVGSSEEVSIKRLADTVWQLYHGVDAPVKLHMKYSHDPLRWWVLPDLTRTKAIIKYKPKMSLRTGIWELLQ